MLGPAQELPKIILEKEIPVAEVEAAAADLVAAEDVREYGERYKLDPDTRAHIDVLVDLPALTRLQRRLGVSLSVEGEKEVRRARYARFLEDALIFASTALREDIDRLIETDEDLEKIEVGESMLWGAWAIPAARRFAARKLQRTLAGLPFSVAFSRATGLAEGTRDPSPGDYESIELWQWKMFVLEAAKAVRAQYEEQMSERLKYLEDERRAELMNPEELVNPEEWREKAPNLNVKTTIAFGGVLGEVEVRGGDEFYLVDVTGERHVQVLDIVAEQLIYIDLDSEAVYVQHRSGFAEYLRYDESIRHVAGSGVVLRELEEAEMLLVKSLFPDAALGVMIGVEMMQAATVFGRDGDEMRRQWSLLQATLANTLDTCPGVYVAASMLLVAFAKGTLKREVVEELLDTATREEESFAAWLRASLKFLQRFIGGRGWTVQKGTSILSQICHDLKTTLWAEVAFVTPIVDAYAYANEENIDDALGFAKAGLASAAQELPEAVVAAASAELVDATFDKGGREGAWDLRKELEGGSAAAAKLGELIKPLGQTL